MLYCVGVSLSDVKNVADPLSKVEAGLKVNGGVVPLQAVHVRAQLIDLAAKVHTVSFVIVVECLFTFRLLCCSHIKMIALYLLKQSMFSHWMIWQQVMLCDYSL